MGETPKAQNARLNAEEALYDWLATAGPDESVIEAMVEKVMEQYRDDHWAVDPDG